MFVTESRRKPAMLMLYLITRARMVSAKEQLMEGLWPDLSPKSAINSLHQTLYTLRRDLEPWYEEGATGDYVRMESDLVFLDPEMFQVDSIAFNRQVADILRTGASGSRGPEMLSLYRGRFAPEFEYEEWADAWRTQTHGAYLHLAHSTARALIAEQRLRDAVDVLTPLMQVDPLAFDLRSILVACLAELGATDAAMTHYRSLAAAHMREVGAPAPSYESVLRSLRDTD
jgi:DNA-binding SARP family transcriptional activator